MKLRSIIIEGNKQDNKAEYPIRWYAHHIVQLFMYFLTEKIEIDGMTQITIVCGQHIDGINWKKGVYHNEAFDCEKFKQLSPKEKDEYFVSLIEETLIRVAQKYERDERTIEIIRATCRRIRENDYRYKIKVAKLSKMSPDKQYKTNVYRCLSYEEGEAWYLEIEDRKKNKVHVEWLTRVPDYLDKREFFKMIVWEDGCLNFYNHLRKKIHTIKVGGKE